jgi:hypothetical protein
VPLAVGTRLGGRLLKRHALPKGTVPAALAASRDGKTFFFADGGTIYSLDAATGATKKLCLGHGVAGDPRADELVVQRNAASGVQLVRVALTTGVETPVPVTGPLKLAPASLAQGAIGPDRRILVTAISQDTWAPIPAILDPGTGVVHAHSRFVRRRDRGDRLGPERVHPRHGTRSPRRILDLPATRVGRAVNWRSRGAVPAGYVLPLSFAGAGR